LASFPPGNDNESSRKEQERTRLRDLARGAGHVDPKPVDTYVDSL